jgi:fructose-bisphosphate aldolase class II
MKEMLIKAKDGKYAVGQFNTNNLEWTMAILEEAKNLNSPLIVGVSEGAAKYMGGFNVITGMVNGLIKDLEITIPVCLHVDHGTSFESCKKAIDAGFTSVMIDASKHELDENIRITKQVVDYAHERGVVVEAELGKIIGTEDMVHSDTESFTDPDEAKDFVTRTGVDSLAISIGTAHGVNKSISTPVIQYEVIENVHRAIPNIPLVAHGSSTVPAKWVELILKHGGEIKKSQGISEVDIQKMSKTAICKINMDTDIRLAFTAAIRSEFNNKPETFDPRKYLGKAKDLAKSYMIKMINLLNK